MSKQTQSNIDKLLNQRRLNVQEQISVNKHKIYITAKHWRTVGLPEPLRQSLENEGIDVNKSIIIEYEQDFTGASTDEGIILTPDGRFFEFDIDLNTNRTEVIQIYSIVNISDRFEINEHKKGIGQTHGFLAMEVLKELNEV